MKQVALIARRNPVASDLRAIIALAKISAELDRAGAESRKIARTVLQQGGRPERGTSTDARHLARLACSLLRKSLEALDGIDAELADEVIDHDQDLDAEYAAGLRRLLTRAWRTPSRIDITVEAAFVLKALERIGDHARNVSQQVAGMAAQPIPRTSKLDPAESVRPAGLFRSGTAGTDPLREGASGRALTPPMLYEAPASAPLMPWSHWSLSHSCRPVQGPPP